MDTQEQLTTWPPAPTIDPPKLEDPKSAKLRMPSWLDYWSKYGVGFFAISYIVQIFCQADHVRCPQWASIRAAIAAWFVAGGLMTAWKNKPKRMWKRD